MDFHIISWQQSEINKVLISLAGIGLAWAAWYWQRQRQRQRQREQGKPAAAGAAPPPGGSKARLPALGFTALLAVLAVASSLNYNRLSVDRFFTRVEWYDVFHYYINSKYFSELGYENIYSCALTADAQNNHRLKQIAAVRRLSDYEVIDKAQALKEGEGCQARFTPARWEEFKGDVDVVVSNMGLDELSKVMVDRGFHGSPTWIMVGHALAELFPLSQIFWRTKLDLLLLLLSVVGVGWVFGVNVGLASWIFAMTFFSYRWPVLGGAMWRYDWIAACLLGVCLLERGRHAAAAVPLAYAALVRLFPVLFVVGLLLQLGRESWQAGKLDRRLRSFVLAYAISLGVMVGVPAATYGTGPYKSFAKIMTVHLQPRTLSKQRMGLAVAVSFQGEAKANDTARWGKWWTKKKEQIGGQGTVTKLTGLLALVWLFAFVRRQDALGTVGASFLLFFVLLNASYYYYVAVSLLVVWHLKHLRDQWHVAALSWLLALSGWANYLDARFTEYRYFLTSSLSIGLAAYGLLIACPWFVGWYRARHAVQPVRLAFEPIVNGK